MPYTKEPFSAPVPALLALHAALHFVQNALAFTVVALVNPLTYSVASVTKRVVVIAGSVLVIQNEVGPLNAAGIAVAVGGVLAYNLVKYRERRRAARSQDEHPKSTPSIA